MRPIMIVAALAVASVAAAAELPAAYAEAITGRDFAGLLTEINKQFDIPPIVVSEPAEIYPEIAGKAGAQGTVKILVYVDENGDVRDEVIADSPGWLALEEAARKAARTMKYKPAKLDDEAVAAWYVADIMFYIQPSR